MVALKGAFIDVGAGLLGALPNVVVFQFNPDQLTRNPTRAQPPPPPDGCGQPRRPAAAGDAPGDHQLHAQCRRDRSARERQPDRGGERSSRLFRRLSC